MFFIMVIALILGVVIVLTPVYQIAAVKFSYYANGITFMWKANDLPKQVRGNNHIPVHTVSKDSYNKGRRVIRVYFIRHGQSTWNSVVNTFGIGWPIRFIKALLTELELFFTSLFESVIIDSPLSDKGKKEVNDLSLYIRAAKASFPIDPHSSVIVSSNLRRAMETALTGLSSRLELTHEQIVIDSSLQEGSLNIDAQTLSTDKGKLAPVKIGPIVDPSKLIEVFNPYLNAGGKVIGVNIYDRMEMFIKHLFGDAKTDVLTPTSANSRSNGDIREVIVVGHSSYFRNFFRRFLPPNSSHVAKKRKMENCAVVGFDLIHYASNSEFVIDERSIRVFYKGFKEFNYYLAFVQ